MRDFRKFCRPKAVKYPKIGDIQIKLKCGETVTVGAGEFKKINKFFKKNGVYGGITDLSEGDIKVFNSDLNEDMYIPANQLANLGDSWDVVGLYGIDTYDENIAPGGSYIIMSNGNLLIINPEDYSKVSSNWQHVDDIVEPRIIVKYIADLTYPVQHIVSNPTNLASMEVDGVQMAITPGGGYGFSTSGEHIIKYTCTDPTITAPSNFASCQEIIGVFLPEGLTVLGVALFASCTRLEKIRIPNSVTSIGDSALRECPYLVDIYLGSGLTTIGVAAFMSCTNLPSITIPSGVTTIGESSFKDCYYLETVHIIGNENTVINNFAFKTCQGLKNLTIDHVKTIGQEAFSRDIKINQVDIPEGIESIGANAFYSCSALQTVTIGSTIQEIGDSCFQYSGIRTFTIKATTPPTLGENVFNAWDNFVIYVPAASVDAYKAASGWSNYADKIQAIPA